MINRLDLITCMPLERIRKGFKDLSMSLKTNPLNNDVISISNETAIARSLRNIVLTQPGERVFNNELGSEISNSLFENFDEISADTISSQIRSSIDRFEPRVRLIDVEVVPDYDSLEYLVTISYRIIGIDSLPQQLSFALEQTR